MKKIRGSINSKYLAISIILTIVVAFNVFLYVFDKNVMPRAMELGSADMRAKAIYIINSNVQKLFKDDNIKYEDMVKIDRDKEGNIIMMQTNTVKMNTLASEIALNTQDDLREFGALGFKVPLGYVVNNNIIAHYGPKITINMRPIEDIKISYSSEFESAGINQTRHKIYLIAETKIMLNTPLLSRDEVIRTEIPILENIIVGKVPETSINIDGK